MNYSLRKQSSSEKVSRSRRHYPIKRKKVRLFMSTAHLNFSKRAEKCAEYVLVNNCDIIVSILYIFGSVRRARCFPPSP